MHSHRHQRTAICCFKAELQIIKTDAAMPETLVCYPSSFSSNNPNALSTGSKMSKIGRKRTRASRAAPTIVIAADISNFREKVQKFTGMQTSSSASRSSQNTEIEFAVPRSNEIELAASVGPMQLVKPTPQRPLDHSQWPACNNMSVTSIANRSITDPTFMFRSFTDSTDCDFSASLPNFFFQPLAPFDGRYSLNPVVPHDHEFLPYQYL